MGNNLSKISEYLKLDRIVNDKRVVVFLVCLAIATALWFLNALSKDYSTTLSYPVRYISPPSNQFLANQPEDRFEIKVNAHGFTLLRHKLSLTFSPIILNISSLIKYNESTSGRYVINTNSLIRQISDQVSSEIQILEIHPERLSIALDSLATKEVPVNHNVKVTFKEQFDQSESIALNPSKVSITGPAALLDTILYLNTEKVAFDDLDSDINQFVKVMQPKNTKITPDQVKLFVPVEKFTEKEIVATIRVKNTPKNSQVKLFPSSVKIAVLIGLSDFKQISEADFEVFVDIDELSENSETLPIHINSKASRAKIIRFSPEVVEYLIEKNF